jgi:hypothetical protein
LHLSLSLFFSAILVSSFFIFSILFCLSLRLQQT